MTNITSYFSKPVDLASEMRDWPEFIKGEDYSVDLKSEDGNESVTVRIVEKDERCLVVVSGVGEGTLYDKALGRAIVALAKCSDDLLVDRDSDTP